MYYRKMACYLRDMGRCKYASGVLLKGDIWKKRRTVSCICEAVEIDSLKKQQMIDGMISCSDKDANEMQLVLRSMTKGFYVR